jgi:hypothetical protein
MTATATVRHRVALAGRVTDAVTSKPITGAQVAIVDMPQALAQKVRYADSSVTPGKTLTREDGLFYFLDLPDGKYTLIASIPACGKRYGTAQQKTKVKRDKDGNTVVECVNFALQPTAIKGHITAGNKAAVMMARVQIKGSGEGQFSSDKGEYMLVGVEPGNRTVQVFAQGYRPTANVALLSTPGEVKTLDFHLEKEGK